MKKVFKNLLLVLIIIAGLAVILNMSYFLKQANYFLVKVGIRHELTQNKPDTNNLVEENKTEKGEPDNLSIPSLQITAPIKYAEEINEDKFQELLVDGIVHYPGTAKVGELGNAYLFGHSSDFAFSKGNYKTVFALLPHIEKGAEVIVSNRDGQIFHYEVIDSHVVNKDDVSVLSQKEYKEKLLTLQTSYPIGTALKRWIVVCKLKE